MAVSINPVRGGGGGQRQQRAPESSMDKIFKALQIANTGMGIAVNFDTFINSDERRETARISAEAERTRSEAGIIQAETSLQKTEQDIAAAPGIQDIARREVSVKEGKLAEDVRSNKASEEIARLQVDQKKIDAKVKAKKLNDVQGKVQGFANRMEQVEVVFDDLDQRGYDRSDISSAAANFLPNVARSNESQMQEQAERNFVNSVLRRESGAVISDAEFENAEQQYFPRAGDGEEVIAQKSRNREIVLDGFKKQLGDKFTSIKEVQQADKNKGNLDAIRNFDPTLSDAQVLRAFEIMREKTEEQ